MHKTIQLDAEGINLEQHRDVLADELENRSRIYRNWVRVGFYFGKPYLSLFVEFNDVTAADDFCDWMKDYVVDNYEDFETARTITQTCLQSQGCHGSVWNLEGDSWGTGFEY